MARLRKIRGRYYAYFYESGRKPKEKSVSMRTNRKDLARRKLSRLEVDYVEGRFDPWLSKDLPRSRTVSEALAEFLDQRKSELRPKSLQAYQEVVGSWLKSVPINLLIDSIEPSHAAKYLDDQKVRPATRLKRYRHLKSFFNWCVERGLCQANPLTEVKPPKVGTSMPKYLTRRELERLLIAIDADVEMRKRSGGRTPDVKWLKDLILLGVSTGMRLGELLSLRWEAVDFDNRNLMVRNTASFRTKSGNERTLPLAERAVEVLAHRHQGQNLERDGLVITSSIGRPIQLTYASQRFKHYVRLAKLPEYISFHSLRHTCASWLVMDGEPLSVVQAILGHSNISVTQQYAHLAPEIMQRAVNKTFAQLPAG